MTECNFHLEKEGNNSCQTETLKKHVFLYHYVNVKRGMGHISDIIYLYIKYLQNTYEENVFPQSSSYS